MIYLAIALIIIAVIFTVKPPQFTFKKIFVIEDKRLSPELDSPINEDKTRELNEDKPPTMEDVVSALNKTVFDIQEGGE